MHPSVTFVIPTLNSGLVLEPCLTSINKQDYPKEKVVVLVVDGGSNDNTIAIAKKFGATIILNPLKTAEAAKALGVKAARGEYIALIDSDNILPSTSWLTEMITPLINHQDVIGSEPWSYTWRAQDGFIARYCALIGMNDPLVHFLGNYDRLNLLTGKWTEADHKEEDFGDYLLIEFNNILLPTIGANGTVFRATFLKDIVTSVYLFDIDIIAKTVLEKGSVKFIKVKNGIVHTFCENNILKFARKQRRRVKDYLYHKESGRRSFDWDKFDMAGTNSKGLYTFILYCVTVVPLFIQTFQGLKKKFDVAWFFHPLACEITLWEYGTQRLLGFFKKSEINRDSWKQ